MRPIDPIRRGSDPADIGQFVETHKFRSLNRAVDQAQAEALAHLLDHESAAFIKKYFHAEWPNRSIYHAMFNTDTGEEAVIQAILNFLQQSQSTGLAAD